MSDDHAAPQDRGMERHENGENLDQQSTPAGAAPEQPTITGTLRVGEPVWSRPPIVLGPKVDLGPDFAAELEKRKMKMMTEYAEQPADNGPKGEDDGLVNQLREIAIHMVMNGMSRFDAGKVCEAADRITALQADVAQLKRQSAEANLLNDSHKMRIAQTEERAERAESERDALRKDVAEAERLILHAVDAMTSDQVGEWTGVRAWLERESIDAAAKEQP